MEETYDNYCLRCSRYSKEILETYAPSLDFQSQQDPFNPLGYRDFHACVSKYTFVGESSVIVSCINPVRADKSSDYSYTQDRCLKKFDISREDYEDGQEKGRLAQKVHSYQFLEESRAYWAGIEAVKKAKEPTRKPVTEEEMVNHPNYGKFLELLEKGKV